MCAFHRFEKKSFGKKPRRERNRIGRTSTGSNFCGAHHIPHYLNCVTALRHARGGRAIQVLLSLKAGKKWKIRRPDPTSSVGTIRRV